MFLLGMSLQVFHDLNSKSGEFDQKVHSLRQEIGEQDPAVFVRLVNIYFTSFYGSSLWDLGSVNANKLCCGLCELPKKATANGSCR